MSNKKFILNADDFGLSKEINESILQGYGCGILKSTTLCANGEAFEHALNEILPKCENLSCGVHLNIIEGKSLLDYKEIPLLVNEQNEFKNGYFNLILLSRKKEFLKQVEKEFRAQIEKITDKIKVIHIDSHVHTHAIPNIFKIVCKLAKEYNIAEVRTQYEKFYLVPNLKKNLTVKLPVNIIKIMLLNFFTVLNKKVVKNYNLKTNKYLIGVGYTGMMDSSTIEYGLKQFEKYNDVIVEALIHPCYTTKDRKKELELTLDLDLKDKIEKMGFGICNYRELI